MPNFLQNIGGKIDQGLRNMPQPVRERIMRQAMAMNSGQPYGAALGQLEQEAKMNAFRTQEQSRADKQQEMIMARDAEERQRRSDLTVAMGQITKPGLTPPQRTEAMFATGIPELGMAALGQQAEQVRRQEDLAARVDAIAREDSRYKIEDKRWKQQFDFNLKKEEADTVYRDNNFALSESQADLNYAIQTDNLQEAKRVRGLQEEHGQLLNQWLANPQGRDHLIANTDNPIFLEFVVKNSGDEQVQNTAKIADYQRLWGLDEKTATAVVDGQWDIKVDEQNGVVTYTDKVTQKSRQVPIERAQELMQTTPPPITPDYTIWDMAGDATGWLPATAQIYNITSSTPFVGWINLPKATKVAQAQVTVDLEMERMVEALTKNAKNATTEQQIIRNMLPKRGWLKGKEVFRAEMVGAHRGLTSYMKRHEAMANDPNIAESDKDDARYKARVIRDFLPTLGVPQSLLGDLGNTSVKVVSSLEEANALPKGTTFSLNGKFGTME